MEYIPKPIDTADVTVPEDISEIIEVLAKNTHENWSQGRINGGWTYGDKLDKELKRHPSLIPYEELPESEKNFDRNTSMETIKVLLKMGYTIEKISR